MACYIDCVYNSLDTKYFFGVSLNDVAESSMFKLIMI